MMLCVLPWRQESANQTGLVSMNVNEAVVFSAATHLLQEFFSRTWALFFVCRVGYFFMNKNTKLYNRLK